ncbi:hypothetical protein A3D85_00210 [Candidatus Amesbacteria bacterium RIFCSPHIGHO2_02_FULL_47_9]|uniref:THIF-type NAD/FAD binding fold domain-containing protein n=1 Tax=Candidatus Amesbacteria bacterium RIFCSPHIGHO2_01_FULL_48_32b TaxID=1797253 RepID=A0A1F4YE13_9BACT|nr:MAG: hypothetical protein A2876_04360 [Candidatus Amesbacteria bacterium RIFCSPHIGHO2_01_FULL_48_32b]OGD03937.1 MAG: hypothetical protein A3D85_00210 [Candidatus Amesbacteria bacterium RIFCSPHIGHO2_02_FULL_47_9]OGD07925.1 MAG: hypothetical protein A2899_04935 [Candidatus Amesbacteria bacterium RIFCSPLOWO2_01_FULL_49_25]
MIQIPQPTPNYKVWQEVGKPLAASASLKDKIQIILTAAVCAPSSHNSQPWSFHTDNNTIWLEPDYHRHLAHSDRHSRELYLSLGACLANIEVAAAHCGFGPKTRLVSAADRTSVRVDLKNTRPPKSDLFSAISQRVNYDGPHQDIPIPPKVILEMEKSFAAGPAKLQLVTDSPTKNAIADLVALGDREIFTDPKFIAELVRWLRDASTLRKDGIPTPVLGLPPHLRRMASQFLLSLKPEQIGPMTEADRQKVASSAAIGVIYSQKDNPPSWIEAGRLYQLLSLKSAQAGVYIGARAVLIETGDLHQKLNSVLGLKSVRPLMMFRAGYPVGPDLAHTPRYPAAERMAVQMESRWVTPPADRPTIFKIEKDLTFNRLVEQLNPAQIETVAYTEHYLPDLFSALNPALDPRSSDYVQKLQEFIPRRSSASDGVWIYYPHTRKLAHLPSEEDFYSIITANNARIISGPAQKRLRQLRFGVAGLSGSGTEAVLALAMSGARYFRLADHDYLSGRNKNRVTGQIGENKTWNLSWRLWEHNPFLELDLYPEGITPSNVAEFVQNLDLVIEQTDSSSKFLLRQSADCPIAMVTDLENPVIELERDNKPFFGGRADANAINAETMAQIGSLQESTWYIAHLIGPDNLTAGNYRNFQDILKGGANAYSQTFIAVQSGGGAIGRFVIAFAEGKLDALPDSWIIRTLPAQKNELSDQARAKKEFFSTFAARFPRK